MSDPTAPELPSRRASWGRRRARVRTSVLAAGEPQVWLTGGMLAVSVVMIAGLLGLVLWKGLITFWPADVVRLETHDGRVYMGEVTREERFVRPGGDGPPERRRLVRTGNFRITQEHFRWVEDAEVEAESRPGWAMVLERLEWGRFYGTPEAFVELRPLSAAGGEARAAEVRRLVAAIAAEGSAPALVAERWSAGANRKVLLDGGARGDAELPPGVVAVAAVRRGPVAAWEAYRHHHAAVRERRERRRDLEKYDVGRVNHREERARLALRGAELELEGLVAASAAETALAEARTEVDERRAAYAETQAWARGEFDRIRAEITGIDEQNQALQLVMRTAGEGTQAPVTEFVPLDAIVRAYPANRLSGADGLGLYLARWGEFLTDEPREANSEGGVFPAIFGTVAMTLLMTFAVVPFGVLSALYLREYARAGAVVSAVRIAVNNLAGVPSIVFGVFGLGFFCYGIGASIDELLFASRLPNPTFGKGGLMWASFTLALLALPVVIVATEEALSAVPNSMREGSYACGASKWQTIQRIVLPRALPGIITGAILALARGAGEVAPLMLVGAVKLAPELPIDGLFPFLHPERSFMHLGFHIYDVGFQSQNSEAAKPMVYTTTLLLIAIVALLNVAAIALRTRLRRRFAWSQF